VHHVFRDLYYVWPAGLARGRRALRSMRQSAAKSVLGLSFCRHLRGLPQHRWSSLAAL